MTSAVANVNIIKDNWESVVNKVNRLSYLLTEEVLTANLTYANTGNSSFSKNSQLWGSFGANTITVSNELRGGNVNNGSANLVITSNTLLTNGSLLIGNSVANTLIDNDSFGIANSTTSILITTDSIIPSGNLVLGSNDVITVNGDFVASGVTEFKGVTNLLGNTYLTAIASNGNIGTNISTPVLIYRFPKADYSSGKLMIQIKNTGNTQLSEMVLAHDNTSALITVYGTVAAPSPGNTASSPLGTFSANINNANVELYINQTVANSEVKVIANLIR